MLSNHNKFVIGIGGPTASGKTTLSLLLAQKYNIPILSCDSRQFFRELNIGTAKPSSQELDAAPHFFINNKSIQDDYSVGEFEREAIACITELHNDQDTVLLCGGSGLYHEAIYQGLNEFPKVPIEVRNDLIDELERKGRAALLNELKEKDPVYFNQVDQKNPRRILRALEVIRASGKAFSHFHKEKKQRNFHPIPIFLTLERSQLYERINQRVDLMIEQGLEEEARTLIDFRHKNALHTVGYQEWWDYFDGYRSKEETVELIKRNSRRYAKRQITWFKNKQWPIFLPEESDKIIAHIEREKQRLSA